MAVNKTTQKNKNPQNGTQPTRKKPKKKKSKKIFSKIFYTLLFCFLAVLVVGAGYTFAIIKTTAPINVNEVLSLNQPSSLYDSNGDFMDNLHTDEERYVIDSNEIPDNLKHAFISIEDERFYKHSGIDVRRIVGASILDAKKIVTGQKGLHGASTLTQQLIKNTILTNEFSLERKIKEAYLSISLEKKLTKDQILTAYLNTIPLGGQVYGVEAASLMYFSKSAKDLSLIECAYLAGITQAPTYYSAYSDANKADPSRYINRTLTVLGKMKELNYITDSEYNNAVNSINNNGLIFKSSKKNYTLNYEWFVYPAVDQVKEDLKSKYKYTDEEVSKLLVNGGLKIYTTMDRKLQDFTQETLNNYSNLGMSNKETYDSDGVPLLQASATIVNYKTGEVIAMVGGRGKQKPQSTNRAYDALKPIGSTTKPLTVYGPGIDKKIITAATTIDDAPLPENKLDNGKSYNPQNSPNEYSGLIPVRDALTYSKNVDAVITEDKIGLKTGISYGENLGLKYNSESKSSIAAVALGEFNNNPKDLDGGNTYILANAFGTFGNSGKYTKPTLYTKVVDSYGKTLLDNSKPEQKEVFSPQTAYIMYDMLKGPVTYYNGKGAKWGDMPVAGKTGTTTNSNNLWFAGLTPYLSASVWVGYDKPTKLVGSSSACAVLWGKIMAKAHEGLEVKDIKEPSGIVTATVSKDSGKLATDLCKEDPRGDRVYDELFIEGTEPTSKCDVHTYANVNILNGKLATPGTPSFFTKSKVFIKKKNPNPITSDYQYVLPSSYDTSSENESSENTTTIQPVDNNSHDTTNNNDNNSEETTHYTAPNPVNEDSSDEHKDPKTHSNN